MGIVKLKKIKVNNIKNIAEGVISTSSSFEELSEGNIIGIYGQNGSGKTAMVEVFKILSNLLRVKELPSAKQFLIMDGCETAKLEFEFLVSNLFGEFTVNYNVMFRYSEAGKGNEKLMIPILEEVYYKENLPRKKPKRLLYKDEKDIYIRNTSIRELSEDDRVALKVRYNMTLEKSYSFLFDKEAIDVFDNVFDEKEEAIIRALTVDFCKDLHVIDSVDNGLVLGNLIMPLSVNIENHRGSIPYLLTEVSVMPLDVFETVKKTIKQINIVLDTIIPDLQIEVNRLHDETMESGEIGVRAEFLTHKTITPLPIRCESAGALKIISILSSLIAVFNNPNACVVIDELDSGVFEFLLGEILEVIGDNGRGQLFFTSHNLRVLEVLDHKDLWFTTSNENNRYIQLKGIKSLSNVRDVYLRAVQLGGQNEDVYISTKGFKMKKAFRKAGIGDD